MSQYIEKIVHNDKLLAVIARANAVDELEQKNEQMLFVTPNEFPFQVGIHNRKANTTIEPHFHIPFEKLEDFPVQEFFYVISGKLRIDLYDARENDAKVADIIIQTGDSIVLNTGHGFELLEPCKLLELKQGPYRGKEQEKRYFK